MGTALSAVVSIAAAAIISFIYSWQLALLTLTLVPIMLATIYFQVQNHSGGHRKLAVIMENLVRVGRKYLSMIFLDIYQAFSRTVYCCLFVAHYKDNPRDLDSSSNVPGP